MSDDGAAKERAAIVAYLRRLADDPSYYRDEESIRADADAIERGEHIAKGDDNG